MTTDLRTVDTTVAAFVEHFDNYTIASKLTPHRSLKLDATTESTMDGFRITKILETPSGIYGFGQISAVDAHAQVYVKVTPTDPTTVWTTASSGSDASFGGSRNDQLFVFYRNFLYGGNATGIWKYGDITSSPAFTYNDYTAHLPTGQGIVVGDVLYVPSGNLLLQNDLLGGSGWSVALTLDANLAIKSLAEIAGGNVAIGCDRPDGTSLTYLWNRDTTQNPYDRIPWGYGSLQFIEVVGNTLIGVSITTANATSLTPIIYFKEWTGSRLVTFLKFKATTATFVADRQKFNDLVYFLAELTLNGESMKGVWKIYQKPTGQLTVSFDRLPRNDVAINAGALKGFRRWGDYMFISYIEPVNGGYTIWRTDDQPNFTATSKWATPIFNSVLGLRNKHIPDSGQYKDFVGATVTTEPLPSGAVVTLWYKIDAQSSYTKFLTHSTQNAISQSVAQLGAKIPQHKEIYILAESTGGGEITGIDFLEDITDKKPYG